MKKTIAVLVPLAIVSAVAIGFVNCGGTGGQGSGFGNQFQNTSCAPDSSCMDLSTPSGRVPVGDEARYAVDLRNGDGSPSPNVQVCCECPDGGCSVTDPSSGCALTDSGGHVSGSFECDEDGSHEFECRAPSGFGLDVRNTIVCEGVSCAEEGCNSNQFCAVSGGPCNFPDDTCVALRREGECCEEDDQCIGAPETRCLGGTCQTCNSAGEGCASNTDCCSGNCNIDTSTCIGG